MSEQIAGFFFSCNADKSANDYTIYVEQRSARGERNVTLGARYKNADANPIYEIEMDADDLRTFGHMCIDLARQLSKTWTG